MLYRSGIVLCSMEPIQQLISLDQQQLFLVSLKNLQSLPCSQLRVGKFVKMKIQNGHLQLYFSEDRVANRVLQEYLPRLTEVPESLLILADVVHNIRQEVELICGC